MGETPRAAAPDPSVVDWDLLTRLAGKPHRHLNVGSCADLDHCRAGHDHIGTTEVLCEARTVQHLCDIASVPPGIGYSAHIDARVFQIVTELGQARDRLDRIQTWHSRESGPAGTVGDYCTECAHRWPCPTRKMADGTWTDADETL